ncbi:hypothetical protein [Actinomadura sp. WMMA1423]|uniref:hypothetical protein n=1 Tax=Actinomadura sp. WMMA1423 TaxID=2591108 RepID=UPI00143DE7AF|nr:hypothetical protein [Actinomadura sp. WMMA1423]
MRRAPRILLLLGHAPGVGRLLLHGRLAPVLAMLRLTVLPVLGLPVLGLAVLGLPLLVGGRLLHGRPPRVRLLLLLLRTPGVLRLPGGTLLVRGLLLVRVVRLRLAVLGLAVLRLAVLPRLGLPVLGLPVLPRLRLAVLRLAVLPRLRLAVLRLAVPARARLGRAAGARQVGPAAHAEQITRLDRFVADRTVQGRHDTSPERTPARSSLDVRCSMSPRRGIPM